MRLQSSYTLFLLPYFLITALAAPSLDLKNTPALPILKVRGFNNITMTQGQNTTVIISGTPVEVSRSFKTLEIVSSVRI